MNRFVKIDGEEQRNLFDEPRALLSSFSAKIEIGYLLNIFGENAREDLKLVSRIRNRFAHYLEVRDFDHPAVADMCDKLRYPPFSMERIVGRREIFSKTVAHFVNRFSMEAGKLFAPEPHVHRIGEDY